MPAPLFRLSRLIGSSLRSPMIEGSIEKLGMDSGAANPRYLVAQGPAKGTQKYKGAQLETRTGCVFIRKITKPVEGPKQGRAATLFKDISFHVSDIMTKAVLQGLMRPQSHFGVGRMSEQGSQDRPGSLVIGAGPQFLGAFVEPVFMKGKVFPRGKRAKDGNLVPRHRFRRIPYIRRIKKFGHSALNLGPGRNGHGAPRWRAR